MKICLLAVSVALALPPLAHAKKAPAKAAAVKPASDPYFLPCEEALRKSSFDKLKSFLSGRKDEAQPEKCFRLNESEFLLTVVDTGRMQQGLYFYDAKAGAYELADGSFRPSVAIKGEYLNRAGKRFVLVQNVDMSHGVSSETFDALYLKPGKGKKSFALDMLASEEDACDSIANADSPSEAKEPETLQRQITDTRVREDADNGPRFEFDVREMTCSGEKSRTITRAFEFRNGKFEEVK